MPEEVKNQLEDQETENEIEVEVEEDADTESQEASASEESDTAEPAKASGDDELENYGEGVQKRISKLTAKMREAERREQAALEYAKSVQKQLEEANTRTTTLDNSFVTEFEGRITYQEQALRNQLRDAIDRGDVDGQVEAQRQLAQTATEVQRLNYIKAQREQQAQQPVQPQPQQVQQPQQPKPDPKAEAWAERNEWFGQNEPMTLTAFSIHKQLAENEGFDTTSDEYYAELDRRMRVEFPHKFAEESAPRTTRSGPAVAGATRNSSKNNSGKVKLSKSQVAIANKLGVSLEQYAKQVARMQNS